MENNIGVGAIVGLAFASSIYIWNSSNFTKEQKTGLLICIVFPPAQWLGILLVLAYNNYRESNSSEKVEERKINETKTRLDSTISNLKELKEKGILTEEEYKTKVGKIETEKEEQVLKNSLEYKQLKSLLDSRVLTKEEFESKIQLIQNTPTKTIATEELNRLQDYVDNIKLPLKEEIDNQNKENSLPIYVGAILFFVLLGIILFLNHNSGAPNIEEDLIPPPVEATDTISTYNESNFNSSYQEPLKVKKFVYMLINIQTPVLHGHNSEMYGVSSYCHVEFENEDFYSDIIEVENYNEDSKYKLLDDAESKISEKNQYVGNSLYSNAVVNYGYDAAEKLKDNEYKIKVINRQIFTFDSYSEASVSKKKRSN